MALTVQMEPGVFEGFDQGEDWMVDDRGHLDITNTRISGSAPNNANVIATFANGEWQAVSLVTVTDDVPAEQVLNVEAPFPHAVTTAREALDSLREAANYFNRHRG